jgi:large subunit ribosomal protein L5
MAKEEKPDKDAKGKKDAKPAASRRRRTPGPPRRKPSAQAAEGDKPVAKEARPTQPARLKVHYETNVVPALMKQFGYKTKMQVPRIAKITLNMGVGEAVADKKIMDNAVGDMNKIAGQKPVVTQSRKSVAGFKIRDGYPVGCMVTLRNRRMYEFLDRLVTIALPRVRDFRGISARVLRQPRQLQHGHQGTDHLPRDRVRQDRRAPRDEHLDHHDREVGRGSTRAPRRLQVPVQD